MITDTDKQLAEAVESAARAFNKAVTRAVNGGLEVETREVTLNTMQGAVTSIFVKISKVIEVE